MYRTGVVWLAIVGGATSALASEASAPAAFTLGRVQKELRQGLSQAEVVERLGSPNIRT
jgi:hypothetical protein